LRVSDLMNLSGALTVLRLPLALVFPVVATDPVWSLGVYLLAILSDALDGVVARWQGTVSETGAFADGWLDKIFHVQAAWSFAVFEVVPVWWMVLWFSRELIQIVTVPWYVRRYLRGERPPVQSVPLGKATSILLAVAFVLTMTGMKPAALWVTVCCGVTGVIVGVQYLLRIWGVEELRGRD
ncbi:MAG: CDP-alcohol phosphatidyltransferase family protein, partial [Myxococcota bacterium]